VRRQIEFRSLIGIRSGFSFVVAFSAANRLPLRREMLWRFLILVVFPTANYGTLNTAYCSGGGFSHPGEKRHD
jgi:hypothetical protein